jgi:hypothetical protein
MNAILPRTIILLSAGLAALLLAGCGGYGHLTPSSNYSAGSGTYYFGGQGNQNHYRADPPPMPKTDNVSYWDGDGLRGSPRVVISLSEQKAYFYKGDVLAGVSRISTGREGYDTPAGNFKVTQKSPNHRSNLYGDYVDAAGNVVVKDVDVREDPKPAGCEFLGASMPYFMRVHGGVGMHAGFLPGYPASHGCIRMPEHMARAFFNNVSIGTPVKITNQPVIQRSAPVAPAPARQYQPRYPASSQGYSASLY